MKNQLARIAGSASISMARIVIPLCLAFTCASAWAVLPITGHSSAQGTPDGDRESSNQQLPVGPQPRGGSGAINPSDYGMCGVLGMSGVFSDNLTVARIIVEPNGFYGVYTNWAKGNTHPPILTWTCVRLTDFTGLPRLSDFETSGPYQFTVSGRHFETGKSGGPISNGCIWAGFEGAFSEAPRDYLFVGSGFNGPLKTPENVLTVASAPGVTLTTYAFCSTFDATDFSWKYYPSTPLGGAQCSLASMGALPCELTTTPGPVSTEQYWCYVSGLFGQGPPDDQTDVVKPFSDQLSIGSSPTMGASIYFGHVVNSNAFAWNCMEFRG
jgi:hypothetical protein